MQQDTEQQDVSIFIVADDYQIIEPEQYDSQLDGKGHFVMVTNDVLNSEYGEDNTIYIHRDFNYLNPQRPVIKHILDLRYLNSDTVKKYENEIYSYYIHKYNNGENIDASEYDAFEEYFRDNVFDYIDSHMDQVDKILNEPYITFNRLKNDVYYNRFIWQIESETFDSLERFDNTKERNLIYDYNGYGNTNKIISESRKKLTHFQEVCPVNYGRVDYVEEYAPAAFAARDFNVLYGNKHYHGYLPALGQLRVISDYNWRINDAMKMINKSFNFIEIGDGGESFKCTTFWSSTQYDDSRACVYGILSWSSGTVDKKDHRNILPLVHLDF